MAWTEPFFSRRQVDQAGRIFVVDEPRCLRGVERCLLIINNWRAAHGYPLLALRMTLTKRAHKIDDRSRSVGIIGVVE